MSRDPHPFYVPPEACDADSRTISFPKDEAHHILRVIRLREGDACRVTDGRGRLFRVVLEGDEDVLRGRIVEARTARERRVVLEVGFPVLRAHPRNDWLIEKAVEVGVGTLVPVPWERSVKDVSASSRRRWERIAREAMKQSESVWLPEIRLDAAPFDRPAGTLWILADPAGSETLPEIGDAARVRLLVGPEGGITDGERDRLLRQGAVRWGLGPTRLRGETAAVVGAHRLGVAIREAESNDGVESNAGAEATTGAESDIGAESNIESHLNGGA